MAEPDYPSVDEWQVSFGESKDNPNNLTVEKTGSGDEFKVFGFVKDCMIEFIEQYAPRIIKFTADDDSISTTGNNNRTELYDRLLRRFNTEGYKVQRVNYSNFTVFILTRFDQ